MVIKATTKGTMKLQGRNAIVTGAGGGFGEGIAKYFAESGARIVVADPVGPHVCADIYDRSLHKRTLTH
jgi:NAD(P)-dependent dehydrogenase (short-subunit alcohol dehydrogenase family)